MGTYGFIRITLQMMPDTFRRYAFALAVLAVISIVYGALVALAQSNLKRLIAYTSIAHMGLVVLGIAAAGGLLLGSEDARRIALDGAVLGMVSHGLITGALFLITGSISHARDVRDRRVGGLAARVHEGLATVVAAFASLGLPGLAQFVSDVQIFVGAFAVYPALVVISLVGMVIRRRSSCGC